ncbi:MAG: ABC transporter permease [Candidatus Krumholzibacteria bacterium]|nr:ABC transporter permease [Candidatus Krumholzibacteria bacterium]
MKLLKVAKREYLDRVRKKSFLIGTILGPVLMAGWILVPGLLMKNAPEGRTVLAVVDITRSLYAGFEASLDDTLSDGSRMFVLRNVPATGDQLDGVKKGLSAEVAAGAIEGYIVFPPDMVEKGTATYFGKKVSNIRTLERIENALNETVVAKRLAVQGLEYAKVTEMLRRVKVETVQVLKGGEKAGGFEQTFLTSFVFIMILYMTILLWGIAVQRSIIEEKNNRVVEVLLSSLKPFDLMAGKIMGVGAVGLTQYAIWGIFAIGISSYALSSGQFAQFVSFEPATIAFFVLFFVLGFLFYSTMFAGIGAICNTDQEAQQLQTPISMCLMVTFLIPLAVMQNPDGTFSTVLSLIPFFAPILMFMRINILMPPAWQIALSVAILLASIYIAGVLSAKIFRVGILMYGKRPDLREVFKWLKRA